MSLGTVIIGGGRGFIGSAIGKSLQSIGYSVLNISRQPNLNAISWQEIQSEGLPKECVAVINVAGQNVLDPKCRWTPGFQQNVFASRVHTTNLLANEIKKMSSPPKVFGTISGVGFYKSSELEEYTEESPGGDHDYFSRLCSKWEEASVLPKEMNVRQFVVRSGIVLGRTGGMISQLFWPFYCGLGGPISKGNQYMPWIHIADIAGIFCHAITSENVEGVLNGVAPEIITNKQFTAVLARAMWRPAIFPLPAFAINLAFGPERGKMMIEGQKVLPKRTLESGYSFLYPDIKSACEECARVFY